MSNVEPGWYHAEGDPPGTKRYWDGELWRGEPQRTEPTAPTAPPGDAPLPPISPPSATPGSGVPTPGMPTPPPGVTGPAWATRGYSETSQATTALVLGILGIVCCGVAAPFAWKIGTTEVQAIDAGRRDPGNRSTANAGKILGIIGTVFLALGLIYLLVVIALAVGGA